MAFNLGQSLKSDKVPKLEQNGTVESTAGEDTTIAEQDTEDASTEERVRAIKSDSKASGSKTDGPEDLTGKKGHPDTSSTSDQEMEDTKGRRNSMRLLPSRHQDANEKFF